MRKILLFILAPILLTSCTKQHSFNPNAVAEQYILEHAYHPEHLKVLSCTATLIPDTTIVSTSYHIVAVDGEPIDDRSWKNVTAVYTDSIRISHVHKPAHYYCYANIECMNDCGETVQCSGEVAVFPDGSAIMYRNYQDRYYKSVIDTIYAQRDTLTELRENIGYFPEWNGWLVQQMLLNFNMSEDENCNKMVTF